MVRVTSFWSLIGGYNQQKSLNHFFWDIMLKNKYKCDLVLVLPEMLLVKRFLSSGIRPPARAILLETLQLESNVALWAELIECHQVPWKKEWDEMCEINWTGHLTWCGQKWLNRIVNTSGRDAIKLCKRVFAPLNRFNGTAIDGIGDAKDWAS